MLKFSGRVIDKNIEEKIAGRISIFLDTSIWISVVDGKTKQTEKIKALLRELVKSEKIFCPLTWALTNELLKQEMDSALRVAELMEELSLNLSFAILEDVFTAEINTYIENVIQKKELTLSLDEILVPAPFCCSSYLNMDFQEVWAEDDAEKLFNHTVENAAKLKLVDYLSERYQNPDNRMSLIHLTNQKAEDWYRSWEIWEGNRSKMRHEELTSTLINDLLPRLLLLESKLAPEHRAYFTQHILNLPQDKFGGRGAALLQQMPTLRNYVELHTVAGLNPSMKITANHIYDLNMLFVPLAYADVIVIRDRWIKRLLTQDTSLPQENNTVFLADLQQFETYLDRLH